MRAGSALPRRIGMDEHGLAAVEFALTAPIVLGMVGMIVSMLIIGQGWDGLVLGGLEIGPFMLLAMTVGLSGAAMGLFMPSANNAALDLLPDRVGVVSGLRQFFRQVGGMIGTAGIVVALSLSPDQAAGMREGSRCWHSSITSRALATWGWAWVAPCSMMLTMAYLGSVTGA